ncbi:head decoration protein [Paenibacillus pabuli]|uniref:head decoration protein n=1 Tax=Paenibacillus pabuli TaxID=1472 RepID=UPI001FFE9865|nr:head decoration protein [Paenibacillus pabuli]UPK45884.1 head decoration protein [Paenibacillus pabuli]
MPAYTSEPYDDLIAGYVVPLATTSVIIKAGTGVITRGTVLGVVGQLPASDNHPLTPIVAKVDSTKTDGSQYPYAILADQTLDATTADVRATGYVGGEFNISALKFGGTDTAAQHAVAMRNVNLIPKRIVE